MNNDDKSRSIFNQLDSPVWKDRAELGSKAVLAIVAVAYIVGLLILNFHVRQYGVSYLNFLQLEYALAGFLWLFLIVANYMLAMFVWHWTKWLSQIEILNVKKRWIRILLKLLVASVFLTLVYVSFSTFIISHLSENSIPVFSWASFKATGLMLLNMFGTVALVVSLKRNVKNIRLMNSDDKSVRQLLWEDRYFIFPAIVGLTIMISLYSTVLYPKLSPSIGGGRGFRAEIIIKKDAKEMFRALGFVVKEDNVNLGKQHIILETSEFFLIKPPLEDGGQIKAIRVRKDVIDAVQYLLDKNEDK